MYTLAMTEGKHDQLWLEVRLSEIWEQYYADVPREESLVIQFGSKTKHRLGSIKRRTGRSIITVTGYFRDPQVPEYVIDETIAHELAHYSHGFESPLPQLYRYPHEGGIVRKELAKRGLSLIHRQSRRWLRDHWHNVTGSRRRPSVLPIRRKSASLRTVVKRLLRGRT